MTPEEITLLKESFEKVKPIAEQAAELFYRRLFELNPILRFVFKSDMQEQGRKLMQMIGFAVNGIDRPEELTTAVRALGRQHTAYGVTDDDYETVGSALIWTLEAGLGSAFTPATKNAWLKLYNLLATTMKEGSSVRAEVPLYA